MEVTATAKETEALKRKFSGQSFIVFPEDRMHPIRMKKDLPRRWLKGPVASFSGVADKGENYSFQLGVYALDNLQNLQVFFSDLRNTKGNTIEAKNISCLNTNGLDYTGAPFTKQVSVAEKQVQAFFRHVLLVI